MKTTPSEKECYHDIEKSVNTEDPKLSFVFGDSETHNQSNNSNDYKHSSESDNLIICNQDLAVSLGLGILRSEKHKFSPGQYLQKVFLSSVTQKIKSQSLPNCFEKKKYVRSLGKEDIDEVNETSVPLVSTTERQISDNLTKEASTEAWFKTWPERSSERLPDKLGDCSSVKLAEPDVHYLKESTNNKEPNLNIPRSEADLSNGPCTVVNSNICGYSVQEQLITEGEAHHHVNKSLKSHIVKQCDLNSLNHSVKNGNFSVCEQKKNLSLKSETSSSKSIPLEELLQCFPLAYSPETKQLVLLPTHKDKLNCADDLSEHFVVGDNSVKTFNLEESESEKYCGTKGVPGKAVIPEVELKPGSSLHRVSTDVSSFSSTVSSLSDNSPSTNDDSALGSLLDHGDTCSLVSVGECSAFSEDSLGSKPKKKSLTQFFSKNVFNWKSNSKSEDSIAGNGASWKLFGKNSPRSSHSSLTVDQSNEPIDDLIQHADGWSLAPDSPCSVRSGSGSAGSNAKERTFSHENRVASSSALIQMDRPANLPAKSEEEEARHRQEYQQMVEAARKREVKEAKNRKKQMQLQLRAEEQLAQATRVWTREVLPRWDQMCASKKTHELWWQGVPPCVRGKVWKLAIGNPLNLTHSLYDICVQRAQDKLRSGGTSSDDEDSDNKEASMQLIQLDISRTFPHLCIFQKGGPYYDMLHSLLAAYVCYRPDVGYVQGMSFIAAVLILNMDAPDAFVCFANLLNRPCHMAFFHLNQPLMQAYYSTYNELFKENLPQLYAHFCCVTLTPDLYLLDWIYTVFTKAMNLDLASRVWDVFLRDGEIFLFRTALGILHLCQDSLLHMDFVHGSQFLTRLPDDLSGDLLFKSISCIKMTVGKQTFDDILATHSVDSH